LEDALKSSLKSTPVGAETGGAAAVSALLEQPPTQLRNSKLAAPIPTCEMNSFLSMLLRLFK
jgi:hypothetical protein